MYKLFTRSTYPYILPVRKPAITTLGIIFTFLMPGTLFSQSLVTGRVLDAISRQPLEGATISALPDLSNFKYSDATGTFNIKTPQYAKSIMVSYVGYQSVTIAGGSSNLLIELHPDVVNLKGITISKGIGQQKFSSLAKVDLDLRPVKTSQDLMRIVPGLFVAQHAGGGKAEQIFLRGFDCDHGTDIAVTVDGMPVNMVSHAHGQGYADAHFIIPETVNNIDYGTGPYYAQKGNLNTAGYVAFSTFNNIAHSQVQVEAGRFDTYRALAMLDLLKNNKDKQSAYIAGEFNYTNGPTINPQHFNRLNLFGKYNLAISDNMRLSASISAFKSKWDASGQVPTRAIENGSIDRFGSIDPTEGGNTERYNMNVNLSNSFGNGYTLTNQVYFTRNIFDLYSNFTFFANDPVQGDEINQAEKRNLLGFATRLAREKEYRRSSISSEYGIGLRHDATYNSMLSNVVKRKFLSYIKLGDITESNWHAYARKQLAVSNWLIDGSIRFDYLDFNYHDKLSTTQLSGRSKGILSPKLNIQYTVNNRLQLYAKTGKGFHSNDSRVVVANMGEDILPAAYGADLGVILKPTPALYLNIAAWSLILDQEFVYVGDDGNIEPGGKTQRVGLDFIARYQIMNGLFANANINLSRGRLAGEPKGANYIALAPHFTSTGGIFYKKKEGLNGGLSYRLIGDRPANEDNSIVAKGYCVLDGSLNYTKQKYEVGVAFENLLNTTWNEAQFATLSRLQNEPAAIDELNFTPGTPFFFRLKLAVFF